MVFMREGRDWGGNAGHGGHGCDGGDDGDDGGYGHERALATIEMTKYQ